MGDCVNCKISVIPTSLSCQKGLTLIEVLVALLVLSIGLVGVAALILFGLKSVHSSLQSSLASVIALDAEEWVWEALGDGRLKSCSDLETIVGDLDQHWFPGNSADGAVALTLPGGTVTFDACSVDTDGRYGCRMRARLDISWSEGRFAEAPEAGEEESEARESFRYWLQSPCAEVSS